MRKKISSYYRDDMRLPAPLPVLLGRHRPAATVSPELSDCVPSGFRPSSSYRSPSFVVGIAPPISPRPVIPPRLPYRWAGRCVGDGTGDGEENGERKQSAGCGETVDWVFGNCRQAVDSSAVTANAGTTYLPYRPRIGAGSYSVFVISPAGFRFRSPRSRHMRRGSARRSARVCTRCFRGFLSILRIHRIHG